MSNAVVCSTRARARRSIVKKPKLRYVSHFLDLLQTNYNDSDNDHAAYFKSNQNVLDA